MAVHAAAAPTLRAGTPCRRRPARATGTAAPPTSRWFATQAQIGGSVAPIPELRERLAVAASEAQLPKPRAHRRRSPPPTPGQRPMRSGQPVGWRTGMRQTRYVGEASIRVLFAPADSMIGCCATANLTYAASRKLPRVTVGTGAPQ